MPFTQHFGWCRTATPKTGAPSPPPSPCTHPHPRLETRALQVGPTAQWHGRSRAPGPSSGCGWWESDLLLNPLAHPSPPLCPRKPQQQHQGKGLEASSEMKVIEKIQEAAADGRTVFSFEYFPPKTEEGLDNLFERMDRMVAHGPNFCDITWGAGGSTADLTLEIANRMQNMVRLCVCVCVFVWCRRLSIAHSLARRGPI